MRDLYNNISAVAAHPIATLTTTGSPQFNTSGDIDLQFFESATVLLDLGDIDELGGSPVGTAKVEVQLEHADDDGTGSAGTYSNVALADVVGPSSVSNGIVGSYTDDQTVKKVCGYIGGKRFIRLTARPTGLTNGGPVSMLVIKGHPRHAPAT